MKTDTILIASDHAGFKMKEQVKEYLNAKFDFQIIDLGTNDAKTSVDYPDFAHSLAKKIDEKTYGILICGTGIGISIAANRHEGVRAALCHNVDTAILAREHNDANVIAFGARVVDFNLVKEMLKAFFTTQFAGGRHENRVKKIETKG
ncbi:ribose 5-phosphate isomerase B [Campylobacter sp. 9BO]|uniref:ribose 5-phosphate isomerase B n=1 Tax=Campylobacter sp. 9BO TaxID=3424759 RepID=UPI003D3261DE